MEKTNLKRLRRSVIPMRFIEAHGAVWGMEQWLSFCDLLVTKGYMPINLKHVEQLLNDKKIDFLAQKNKGRY